MVVARRSARGRARPRVARPEEAPVAPPLPAPAHAVAGAPIPCVAGEHRNRTDPSALASRRNGFEDRGGHQAAVLSRGTSVGRYDGPDRLPRGLDLPRGGASKAPRDRRGGESVPGG